MMRVSVFIYSMPGCPVRERMLYSSCKGPVVDMAEQLGVEISRKVSNRHVQSKVKLLDYISQCNITWVLRVP